MEVLCKLQRATDCSAQIRHLSQSFIIKIWKMWLCMSSNYARGSFHPHRLEGGSRCRHFHGHYSQSFSRSAFESTGKKQQPWFTPWYILNVSRQNCIESPCLLNDLVGLITSEVSAIHPMVNWAALREKVHNGLSRCHTIRRMGVHGRAHPSFGITSTF